MKIEKVRTVPSRYLVDDDGDVWVQMHDYIYTMKDRASPDGMSPNFKYQQVHFNYIQREYGIKALLWDDPGFYPVDL